MVRLSVFIQLAETALLTRLLTELQVSLMSELGIIPCGSGNDVARYLYPVIDPLKLIRVLPVSTSKP